MLWLRLKNKLRRSSALLLPANTKDLDSCTSHKNNIIVDHHHDHSSLSPPLPSSRRSTLSFRRSSHGYPPSEGRVASSSPERSHYYSVDDGSPSRISRREDELQLRSETSPDDVASEEQEPWNQRVLQAGSDRHAAEQGNNSPPPSGLNEIPTSPSADPPTSSTHFNPISFNPAANRGRDQPAHAVGERLSTNSQSEDHSVQLQPLASFPKRPCLGPRRQSLLSISNQQVINSLLDPGAPLHHAVQAGSRRVATTAGMAPRKIWVKRPGGSATLVPTAEDSLVDEVRDQVIMKYANSLGKTFDAPDITIRISPREGANKQATPERVLSPEEPLVPVVDTYFPGGQTVEEALIIDMPQRRTPKPSPRHSMYYHHSEPGEHGDYFPLMPVNVNVPTPPTHASNSSASVNAHPAPSISILTTGHAPPVPSPGGRTSRHTRRPPITRHATNSPTIHGQGSGTKDSAVTPAPQPTPQVPTPPGPAPPDSPQNGVLSSPARVPSPRPRPSTKPKKGTPQSLSAFGGLIEGTVPPINVLIVEDNVINQRLLEAFMKRLSVRWKCAANGAEAVQKWREGGFHLVLMDIQLPVMNGLDATKEIRRLERLNGIGVFPKTASGRSSVASATAISLQEKDPNMADSLREEDTLKDPSLFKSPVIIVALTASSLQSDRHEALAAGCNDFLTKPVRFEWLEQKVTEWGCMQALIDFEGWRKWRGFAVEQQAPPWSDGPTGPMQISTGGASKQSSPVLPALPSARASKKKGHGDSKLADKEQDDSSGNGSSEALDSSHPWTSDAGKMSTVT
ncbi:hypothetical protein EYZ11_002162 [Aspergillus tanneri]|uniref:Ssk1 response regulator receiver n=1 Tax=Aspergillus tanneri TaxID=1220188 RepID=A0A4S3JU60_9EURO|nr:ssk1 response regulator receiver [Aspergillus tanneri]KAA8641891.1 ssk1 response regulator receiver [Aspergillus tanneri]THC98381.1 hypothetical protein EYZ11_002162 [Aspergillus tanneri]